MLPTGTQLLNPDKALDAAGLKERDKIADLGAGAIGHFVFPASRRVGREGKVYAVDIQQSVLEALKGRVAIEGTTNMELVWGDIERPRGTRIPDDTLDVVLIVNTLAAVSERLNAAREALRILKSSGRFIVIDWKPSGAPFGPDVSKRLSQDKMREVLREAGFRDMGTTFEPGPYHYGLVFEKP